MSLEDLRQRAKAIQNVRPSIVLLSGGEPAEHEDILEIVRILAKEFRFKVSMITNGIRLGTEEVFASQLKQAGLRKACIAFDTLKPEVSMRMRGRADLIEIKRKAFQHGSDAGLKCSMVTTVCDANVSEMGDLLRFVLQTKHALSVWEIHCFQQSGRMPADIQSVDREQIIKTLIRSEVIAGLKPDDFSISLAIPALGLCVHPDCGSALLILSKEGKGRLLSDEFDQTGFFRALSKTSFWSTYFARLWFAAVFLKHFGLRGLCLLRHGLRGERSDSERLILISIASPMSPEKLDCERVKRCTNAVVLADGSLHPMCFYYSYENSQKGVSPPLFTYRDFSF